VFEPFSWVLTLCVVGWAAWEDHKHGEVEVTGIVFWGAIGLAITTILALGNATIFSGLSIGVAQRVLSVGFPVVLGLMPLLFVVCVLIGLSAFDSDQLGGADLKVFAGLLAWHGWIVLPPLVLGGSLAFVSAGGRGRKSVRLLPFVWLGLVLYLAINACLVFIPAFA